MSTIVIVEDEMRLASVLADYFRQAGYSPLIVADGSLAVEEIRHRRPDAVLLDLMLPGKDGIAICREVREFSQVPILMVTARVEEIDRLLGLEVGADDYICKPFSPREVVARVKAVLRRSERVPGHWDQTESVLKVDEERQCATVRGERLDLTPTEFKLLRLLWSSPGRVFARSALLDLAYDPDQDVSDRAIDSHVKNLRKKLSGALPGQDLIHSVYGVGYRFEPT